MPVKGMFLKKNKMKKYFVLFVFIGLFLCNNVYSNQINYEEKIINYFFKIENFTSTFIQSDEISVEEGIIYLKKKINRIKIKYNKPSNIVIILAKKRGLYLNLDLEEIEYFNPEDSIANIFYDIFYNVKFLDEASIKENNSVIEVTKNINLKNEKVKIKIIFEKNPLLIKKLIMISNEQIINLTLINPNFNAVLDSKIFSLANPLLN